MSDAQIDEAPEIILQADPPFPLVEYRTKGELSHEPAQTGGQPGWRWQWGGKMTIDLREVTSAMVDSYGATIVSVRWLVNNHRIDVAYDDFMRDWKRARL